MLTGSLNYFWAVPLFGTAFFPEDCNASKKHERLKQVKNNKFRDDFDDDEYSNNHHHTSKKKREKRDFDEFGGNAGTNKKCKQCALKNECDQSNSQRCKRFTKNRGWDNNY